MYSAAGLGTTMVELLSKTLYSPRAGVNISIQYGGQAQMEITKPSSSQQSMVNKWYEKK